MMLLKILNVENIYKVLIYKYLVFIQLEKCYHREHRDAAHYTENNKTFV